MSFVLLLISVLLFLGGALFKTDVIFGMSLLLLGLAFLSGSFLIGGSLPWRKP